jgi:hypothetical protein
MGTVAYRNHRQSVAGLRLRRLGPGRGHHGLGWGLWLGLRLRWRLVECRLGRLRWRLRWRLVECRLGRLRWRLRWRLGWRLEWLGWGCLHLDGVGLAVLTFSLTSERKQSPC